MNAADLPALRLTSEALAGVILAVMTNLSSKLRSLLRAPLAAVSRRGRLAVALTASLASAV